MARQIQSVRLWGVYPPGRSDGWRFMQLLHEPSHTRITHTPSLALPTRPIVPGASRFPRVQT